VEDGGKRHRGPRCGSRLSERRRRKCGEKFFFSHLKKLHSLPNFTFIFLIFQSLDDLARELLLD
jgi:hypothetical protein